MTETSPFAEPPPTNGHSGSTWVRPEIVVEVAFAQRTRDGHLRAPVFLRVRDDKTAAEVVAPVDASDAPADVDAVEADDVARTFRRAPEVATPSLAHEIERVLAQLETPRKALTLEVEGFEIAVTNLDKVMWPAIEAGQDGRIDAQRALTKRDLLAYLARAAHLLLPHLRDRPLTLTRFPNGLAGGSFYQKHVEKAPAVRARVPGLGGQARPGLRRVCNNLATLLWTGQLANLALHTSLARVNPAPEATRPRPHLRRLEGAVEASVLNYPDFVLFDLDPYIYAGPRGRRARSPS